MEYVIIIVLLVIILLLTLYLFFINHDLKRISKEIDKYKDSNSNHLIHSQIPLSNLTDLIRHINVQLEDTKKEKIYFEHQKVKLEKMLMNISHDLRTPLTSALGYIDIVLKSDLSDEEKNSELKIIEDRLKRLEQLINSFFEFSTVSLNDYAIELKEINLIEILEECISHYYDDFQKQKRNIILTKHKQKYYLLSNKNMLMRIFDNLISNAFKHGYGDLKIDLNVGSSLELTFKNKIVDEHIDLNHIFDEFYTTDISRTKGNTGLGLAIAKEFTTSLNGRISANLNNDDLYIVLKFKIESKD